MAAWMTTHKGCIPRALCSTSASIWTRVSFPPTIVTSHVIFERSLVNLLSLRNFWWSVRWLVGFLSLVSFIYFLGLKSFLPRRNVPVLTKELHSKWMKGHAENRSVRRRYRWEMRRLLGDFMQWWLAAPPNRKPMSEGLTCWVAEILLIAQRRW